MSKIGTELESLKNGEGAISPHAVLEFAQSNPDSECHRQFEIRGLWDDSTAADLARVSFARGLIQRYRVRVTGNDGQKRMVRAMVSTRESRPDGSSYRPRVTVMDNAERRRQMHRDCAAELRSIVNRYCDVLDEHHMGALQEISAQVEYGASIQPRMMAAGPA